MPTHYDEQRYERDREEAGLERSFLLEKESIKNAHELQVIAERGKVASERLRIAHRANSRASMWKTFFTIVPKSILIISQFWLILFHREVPKSWDKYLND